MKLYKPTHPMKYKARLGFPPITPRDCEILNDACKKLYCLTICILKHKYTK